MMTSADQTDDPGLADIPAGGYNGAPWRSRYLRGPKMGLELAARSDFVALGDPEIATVKLGLKTGKDSFFFLTATGEKSTASRIRVKGMGGLVADLPAADLHPGLQTPKDLDTPQGRLAAVPTRRGKYSGDTYYLFPRTHRLDKAVKDYVEYGEARDVDAGDLVRSNAETKNTWYRQTRNQVRSRWALPYNSGYDYGAIDNQIGAVLNGRLVGVEPAEGIDADLLGGILNSTFVTLMRLLEGVATGNEGAFDVGPPAARVMRIPSPRKMTAHGADRVAEIMRQIVSDGILPHAPLGDGTVPPLREQLDLAVLMALGESKGDGVVILDRVYRSYGRWRAAVEAVEDKMQEHRRALSRRGGSRTESPAIAAARTVWDEMSSVTAPLLTGLLSGEAEIINPIFPPEKDRGMDALFDHAVILDANKNPLDLGDTRRVDLARYVRSCGLNGEFPVPVDADLCGAILRAAEAADAAFVQEAAGRAKAHTSDDLVDQVVTYARRAWLAASISEIRKSMSAEATDAGNDPQDDPSLFDTGGLVPPVAQPE
jgi:hypothetical protein